MKTMHIPVFLFNGQTVSGMIESYTTIKEFKIYIMKNIGFKQNRIPHYGIYEICNRKDEIEERFIDEYIRVSDILSIWEREIEETIDTNDIYEFRFYLKILIFYPIQNDDYLSIDYLYHQSIYDVISGKYNLQDKEAIILASLQLYIDNGKSYNDAFHLLNSDLDRYISLIKIMLHPYNYWTQKIMEFYTSISSINKNEVKIDYIDTISTHPLWQSHQYDAKFHETKNSNNENFPRKLVIIVKPSGLGICDKDRVFIFNLEYIGLLSFQYNRELGSKYRFICIYY
jgi:hypothetical protein